jgi:hypothetical protein
VVTGVAGVGEERDRGGVSTANRGGRRSFEGRRRCSGGRRAGEWLDSFYAMTWCWWCAWPGLRGGGSTGRRRGRAAAEARAHRRCGPGDLVWENEIGWACELQWVAVVLLEHWIRGGKRQRQLSTVSRGCGGAPARWKARESERQWKCTCVSARVSPWGAPGRAQGPEEGMAAREQLLATGRRRGGSGRRRRDVERQGGVQRGVESGGAGAGAARGAEGSGAGAASARHMADEGGGVGQRGKQSRGTGGRRRGTDLLFFKSAGTPL